MPYCECLPPIEKITYNAAEDAQVAKEDRDDI